MSCPLPKFRSMNVYTAVLFVNNFVKVGRFANTDHDRKGAVRPLRPFDRFRVSDKLRNCIRLTALSDVQGQRAASLIDEET